MVGMVGRVQREGEVIHVICDRVLDHTPLLRRIGDMAFPHRTGRGDGAQHGGTPDQRGPEWKPTVRDCYWPPHADGAEPEEVMRVKTRNFG